MIEFILYMHTTKYIFYFRQYRTYNLMQMHYLKDLFESPDMQKNSQNNQIKNSIMETIQN